MIASTPPKIFSKEVAKNRPPHFLARPSLSARNRFTPNFQGWGRGDDKISQFDTLVRRRARKSEAIRFKSRSRQRRLFACELGLVLHTTLGFRSAGFSRTFCGYFPQIGAHRTFIHAERITRSLAVQWWTVEPKFPNLRV